MRLPTPEKSGFRKVAFRQIPVAGDLQIFYLNLSYEATKEGLIGSLFL
jgi:hypothetical protein